MTSFRALTVAGYPAIIVVSLSQLAGASSLYQTELTAGMSSNIFGMAAYSSPYLAAAVAPKSTSDDGSDFTFDILSGLFDPLGGDKSATDGAAGDAPLAIAGVGSFSYWSDASDTGRYADDAVPSIGGGDLYQENSPVTTKCSLSQSEHESFGAAEPAATGVDFEVPLGIGMAPSSEFGSFSESLGYDETAELDPAAIGYLATAGPVNGVRGGNVGPGITNPLALSFTAAVTNAQVGRVLSSIQTVPEPESVGTAVVVLTLMIAAFQRRVTPSRGTRQ